MKRKCKQQIIYLFALLFILSSLFGCNQTEKPKDEADKQPSEKTTRVITDSAGREVEIPTNITKVAPSGPIAQLVLYTVNPDKLIGWSKKPSDSAKAYMDKKYMELPEFGMFYGDTFNLEALIAAKPDVIIDIGEAKKTVKEDMDEIQKTTGIPTIFVKATLETTADAYKILGDLLSEEKQTDKLAAYSQKTIEDAKKFAASIPENERVKLYYGSGDAGMNTNGKDSFHAEIIDFIGAENVAVLDNVSSKGGGNEISMEQLLVWSPQVILFDPESVYSKVANGDPLWKELKAVQSGAVYEVPSGPYNWMVFPPSVNRILGVKWLGNLLYPDLYAYDMLEETKEFYQLFYHYDLTDDQAKDLLAHSTLKK